MIDIKKQFEEAVEEFGELAHTRFLRYGYVEDGACAWFEPVDNYDVKLAIENNNDVELKPIEKLIRMDIEFYGLRAYEMYWLLHIATKRRYTVHENEQLLNYDADVFKLERKKSAALPFDFYRAISNDITECLHGGMWKNCVVLRNNSENEEIEVLIKSEGIKKWYAPHDLRMKYPPKKHQSGDFF